MDNGLFYDKYRIDSARLPGFDYSQNGLYFVTICTYEQEMFFGDVKNGKMILNDIGELAKKYWLELPQHFDNLRLDEFVIMPNHVHGILVIDNMMNGGNKNDVRDNSNVRGAKRVHIDKHVRRDAINRVSTVARPTNANNAMTVAHPINADNAKMGGITGKHNPMGKNTLGEFIRWYKGRCKYEINHNITNIREIVNNHVFAWQTRYYDHIIRDEKSLNNIRAYIKNNPQKWNRDRNNQENLWM